MRSIKLGFIESIQKDKNNRYKIATAVPNLIKECRKSLLNFYEFIIKLKVIELASIIWSMERWMTIKGQMNQTKYTIRDIVEVDLGLGYGFEMSYRHPCIVIHDSNAGFCLVVPCSTGKYGKRNKFIIDGISSDGFKENTGVLIDAMRCVSKTRITGKVGEITVPFLNKMNNIILEEYFSRHFHKLSVLEKDLQREREKNQELQTTIENLRNDNK